MAKLDLCLDTIKLTAPNLFDYLQLVDFVNSVKIAPCIFSTLLDKVNLTIYVELYIYGGLAQITALLPEEIIMERGQREFNTFYI